LAEYIRLNFILINHWAPDSPCSTSGRFCLNVDVRCVNRKIRHYSWSYWSITLKVGA
jgi:hypothetical protein